MNLVKTSGGQTAILREKVQPIWDTVVLGIAQTADIDCWATGVGGTFNTGAGSKTRHDTNLEQNGQFSAPDTFFCSGIMAHPLAKAPVAAPAGTTDYLYDLQRALRDYLFQWTEGSSGRRIVEGHLELFPAGLGVDGSVASGATTVFAGAFRNGGSSLGNRFGFSANTGVFIRHGESFRGRILPVSGGVSLSASISLRMYLVGIYGQSTG